MPNIKKMKSSEDVLEKRRIARREKYKQTKNDPEKYAIERAKKREAYIKRKENKKVKSINQMSPKEQKLQRQKWRESSKRYLEKKNSNKKMEEIIIPQVSAINVEGGEFGDPLKIQQAGAIHKRDIKWGVYAKKIKNIKRKHAAEKKEMIRLIKKYKYRCRVLLKKNRMLQRDSELDVEKKANILSQNKKHPFNKRHNSDLRKMCLRKCLQKKLVEGGINSIQGLVKSFYEDDINSRNTAGRKQFVKKHGIKKQKRYLLDSVKNLHKKFLEENTNIRLSYVTFSRLRPFWVYLPRDDRDTCACTFHTNMNLIISALKKNKIVDVYDFQSMLDAVCCDKYNFECVSRNCQTCKDKVIQYKEFCNLQEIEYYEWGRAKKKVGHKEVNIIKKFRRVTTPKKLILELEHSLPNFFTHTANILNQYKIITQLKNSLNDYETLIHMDFSENYNYKFATEVQSFHFGGSRDQVSLHTVIIYLKKERQIINYSLCTISQCIRHDSPAVWAHLQKALEFVFEKSPHITTVHILTDSPSSQYRNKYIFYIMTQLQLVFSPLQAVTTLQLLEAGHGKGAPDGIGAIVKRTADFQVKCGRDVGDFSSFLNVVRENLENVEVRVVEEHEIREKEILLPKNIAPFKGTMKVHQVLWSSKSEFLEFRKLSCYECTNMICKHGKHMQLHKIYKGTVDSTVNNVKIIPENKRIKVLSDISIKVMNQKNIPINCVPQEETVTPLSKVKDDWQNRSFMVYQTGAVASGIPTQHQEEFLMFLNQQETTEN